MKNSFFQKYKKPLQIALCILGFALVTMVYFSPVVFEGKRIKQHDIEMYKGLTKEINDYRDATGEQTLWTNSLFSGMPAWNSSVRSNSNLVQYIGKATTLDYPGGTGAVFASMVGFFILLLVLDCNLWISFIGGLAYGLTSYLFIILGAGHNTKAMAIAYMPLVVAGIMLTYKGKYLWGSVLSAIGLSLEIRANHLQITYYLLFIVLILVIAQFISDLKEKQLARFLKASLCLVVAALLGILTCTTNLYGNYEFSKETTRGKPVLTQNESNQTQGLDRDYITQWSYGKGETWSLLIPNIKGGASGSIGDKNPALDKAQGNYKIAVANCSSYWGDQPGTSGPVYVGAIIVFLFVLGALCVKGKLKWALLIATVLSILLSWGKNFMGFTDFFIDHIPGYNKFRAVSMTLVIAEFTIPLLGLLGLAEILKSPESFKKNLKKLWIAFGVTAGACLVFWAAPSAFFSFTGQADQYYISQILAAFNSHGVNLDQNTLENSLETVRIAIFRKDALRSLLFIVLAFIPIFLYGKGKLKATPAMAILAVLVLIDLYSIDRRYLNDSNYISKSLYDKPFTASAADQYILNDPTLSYRVLNLTKDVFNDASTSYFHKSIGGYHGAKLRRYQDLISGYLSPEIRQFNTLFQNVDSELTLRLAMQQQRILNLLNTKYIIYDPNSAPIENPCAFGNAWTVNDVRWVNTPNEEFDALGTTDLQHIAIINKEFQQQVGDYVATDSLIGQITLTEYKPNQLTYSFNAGQNQLVVFSEIWSDTGWKLYLDGQEHPLLRADYLLRAALIPGGEHQIVMQYAPRIWKIGNTIQLVSSLMLVIGFIAAIVLSFKKKQA